MADEYSASKSSDDSDLAQKLIKQANAAFHTNERSNVETLWAEIAEFILPSQNAGFFGDQSKGITKDQRIFDNVAQMACRDLASSLHSTVTNPASKWSKLRFRETALNDDSEANAWTSFATTEIHNALADSNFDNQMGRAYQSYCGFGTMIVLHDELNDSGQFTGMNFAAWHLSEVAYSENWLGIVDCVYRKFKLTLKQAYEQFGDAIGDVKEQLVSKPLEEYEFYHCIYSRDKKEVRLGPLGLARPTERPIASDYIMCKGNKIVKRDGYYEFPVYVSRWLTLPGEIYGYGPGHIARADVLTLNVIERQILKALAKSIDPVVYQNQNNLLTGDMRPGRIVTVRDVTGIKEAVTQSRFDVTFMESKRIEERIKAAFYIDKLMLPPRTETGEQTAYEIQQRLEQMQVVLGPPLSRLNNETLQAVIMRTLKILMRAGKIPPIPKSVIAKSQSPQIKGTKNIDLEIAFVNSLARSQQMAELRNISAWVQETAGLAQMGHPEALDLINADEIVEKTARIRDIPEDLILSTQAVEKIRQDRQKAVQMQNTLQAGESAGNIIKNVGSVQGGNVQ